MRRNSTIRFPLVGTAVPSVLCLAPASHLLPAWSVSVIRSINREQRLKEAPGHQRQCQASTLVCCPLRLPREEAKGEPGREEGRLVPDTSHWTGKGAAAGDFPGGMGGGFRLILSPVPPTVGEPSHVRPQWPLPQEAGTLPIRRIIPHYTEIFSLIEADRSSRAVMYSSFKRLVSSA